MSISEKLRDFRKEHKLSQRALAEALGISSGAVSHYEAGRMQPSEEVLKKIESVFGVNLAEEKKPAAEAKPAEAKKEAKKEEKKKKKEEGKKNMGEKNSRKKAEKKVQENTQKPVAISVQSMMGGTITMEEILKKVQEVAPETTEIYVKAEENAAYYCGEGVEGSVALWD